MRLTQRLYTMVYGGPVWIRNLFLRDQSEHELDEELRFHLERQVHEDVAHAMDPEEARMRALRGLRSIERLKQECRDVRRANVVEDVI